MKLLVSNVGSTSLKFKLYEMPSEEVLCSAKVERVGSRDAYIPGKTASTRRKNTLKGWMCRATQRGYGFSLATWRG